MVVSERAKLQIKKNAKYLVILVDIGGCKGFFYDFFYSNDNAGYFHINDYILTDEYSLPLLLNCELDFEFEIGFEDFLIHNKSFAYCGCGKSFNH